MLTDQEARMLQLEARPWRLAGEKDDAIRAELGLTPTRYAMALNVLLDTERALAHHPVLVHRLRRLRDQRVRSRRVPGSVRQGAGPAAERV